VDCAGGGFLSGGEGGAALSVEGEAVDHERVAEEVQGLTVVAEAVGSAEPEGVVEVAVDAFAVVATRIEATKVGVGCGDGSDVLAPVQLPLCVLGGAVESDGHDPAAETVGESVVVVPAVVPGLIAIAMCTHARQLDVVEVAGLGQFADTDGATTRVQLDRASGPVPEGALLR